MNTINTLNKGVLILEFDDPHKNYFREKDLRVKKYIINFTGGFRPTIEESLDYDLSWQDIIDYCLNNTVGWGGYMTSRKMILLNNEKISFLIEESGISPFVVNIEKEYLF